MDNKKYTKAYRNKYGNNSAMPTIALPTNYKTTEELYQYCIIRNKRWEDIVPKVPKGSIF